MKQKIYLIILLVFPWFSSCIDDKGNYDYVELGEIQVEGIPEVIEVLSYAENISVTPTITSSIEGEIKADNPNYKIQYRLGYKGMGALGGYTETESLPWVDITPEDGFNLDIPANYSAGLYICWLTITDTRNNAVTSHFFDVRVSSTTSEGWLVLCNEGAEERVRLDIISQLSSTKIATIHDIAGGLPETHHATSIGFSPQMSNPGDLISLHSKEASYMLDNETLESGELMEFNLNRFITNPNEAIIFEMPFAASTWNWQVKYRFAFAESGNVYLQDNTRGGSAYGLAINTPVAGTAPEFKCAPMAGFSWVRPWSSEYENNALFYDITNKRFVGWLGNDALQQLSAIPDPTDNKLFSYTTGKEYVYMEGTRRSNGLVYTILEDASGNRSIYGINMGGAGFVQELYIDQVTAPDFNKATHFAFHSQFPLLFYATDSKVYLYNLGSKTAKELNNVVGSGEIVTKLKFNLFRNTDYASLNNQSEEFMNKQYQLIVATFNSAAADSSKAGKVAFYSVDGINDSVSKNSEYTGFAKVVDVVYREQAS